MCNGQTSITIQKEEKKDTSLQYIKDRSRDIFYTKKIEIDKKFEDPCPKTKKEAEKWLKDGNFRVDIHSSDEDFAYVHFAWGKDAPDYEKRDEIQNELSKDLTELRDTVSIITDENTRLEALKAFEAKVYV